MFPSGFSIDSQQFQKDSACVLMGMTMQAIDDIVSDLVKLEVIFENIVFHGFREDIG